LRSAHDVSDGGLLIALAECCFSTQPDPFGVEVVLPETKDGRARAELYFGEGAGRVIVSVREENGKTFEDLARAAGLPAQRLGTVTRGQFKVHAGVDLPIEELRGTWESGFARIVQREV
jgi:phosphoribosylformylglycinamidine synthase